VTEAIRVEGVARRFGDTVALDGVNLSVAGGSVLGLLGPNGAGKTTMVRILATLLKPDAGRAFVNGHDVVAEAHQVRKLIGLTGQYASVDERLTGHENLMLIARLLGLSRAESRQRTRALLADFHLEEAAHRAAGTYSGGMRRRLDLAASLVGRPRILFLDEPTTGLDPRARLELWNLIRGLVAGGATVLLTTQYLDEADALADRIVVLDRGRVIAAGTPDELKARTGARVLAVRPRDAERLPAVVAALAELTGAEPELDRQLVTVAVTDSAVVPAIVRRLDEAGVVLAELSLRGASLDDVFLALTGHHAESASEEKA
jgi:oleandomycin transport system ATP-binding protein